MSIQILCIMTRFETNALKIHSVKVPDSMCTLCDSLCGTQMQERGGGMLRKDDCREKSLIFVGVYLMQNNTPYYKAQKDPFGGFLPLPFHCFYVFSLSSGDSGVLSTFTWDDNVSKCARAWRLWDYECLLFLPVQRLLICIHVMPHSKRLHLNSEAQRCEGMFFKKGQKREILCYHRRPQWCECARPLVPGLCYLCLPLPESQKSNFKKGKYCGA